MPAGTPRVLHVLEASNHGTGTARHLLDLVGHVDGIDHHVVLPRHATSRGEPASELTADLLQASGAQLHRIPMRRQVVHPDTVRAVAGLRRIVGRVQPGLLHGHSAVGGALVRLVGGPPAVYTPNGLHPSRVAHAVERLLSRRTAAAIAVSRGEATLFVEELGVPAARVHMVPNGIGPFTVEYDTPLPRLPVPEDAVVVGWIGRHAQQKAPDVLIRAAAVVCAADDRVHVVMVGGGPQFDQSLRLVQQLDLGGRVHLLGFVRDARRLLSSFDVLALPSRWEGAPYVPLEAMDAGVPLVLSRCVGNADLVVDGVSGWLVDVDDPAGLATAIREATTSATEASGRAAAARERFVDEYSAERMARRTRAVYDAVLAGR